MTYNDHLCHESTYHQTSKKTKFFGKFIETNTSALQGPRADRTKDKRANMTDAQCAKRVLMPYTNRQGSDQAVHLRSLIRAFPVR